MFLHGVTRRRKEALMTTSTTAQDQLRELEARARSAWEDYRASTSDLDGSTYEETELMSWDRLQQTLNELADERERLVGVAADDG
jgi:signal transduction histidine kinase